jgi:hypothetical protein
MHSRFDESLVIRPCICQFRRPSHYPGAGFLPLAFDGSQWQTLSNLDPKSLEKEVKLHIGSIELLRLVEPDDLTVFPFQLVERLRGIGCKSQQSDQDLIGDTASDGPGSNIACITDIKPKQSTHVRV